MPGDLATRAVSAVILAVPALAAVYVGTPVFELMVAAAGLILAWEWSRMCGARPVSPATIALTLSVASALIASLAAGEHWGALAAIVGALVILLLPGRHWWIAVGAVYIALPCVAIVWLRHDADHGREIIFWLLAVVWAADTGALLFGRAIGGPRLAPRISPNKTWAGLTGAMISAAVVGTVGAALGGGNGMGPAGALGALLGVTGQAGDLWESSVKRRFGVKDTSGLIPGHGGLLDRVDSLLAAALLTALIAGIGKGSILAWWML